MDTSHQAQGWVHSSGYLSSVQRLVALAAVEASFPVLSHLSRIQLKKRGLMPSLTFSNKLISFTSRLKCCLRPDTVKCIITQAVVIEQGFITSLSSPLSTLTVFLADALPTGLIGI
ncbi:hypothetical protein BDR07DRAFT_1500581 [Suillus spraguei]|nr:hypothetical protein BDR07DRAFT_1500581 [Suillus spraguei]